jgi:hypothetical protein
MERLSCSCLEQWMLIVDSTFRLKKEFFFFLILLKALAGGKL